uniref:Reverse transcriptase zinc-binding domain-containing protein n=1 Tax=Cannabis sativa TaxID=3483 RepID=A0A803QER2_CANSA
MGRVTLINSVLLAIHTYWAQIFILPKKLLKDIEATCRSFLWKGTQEGAGPGLVAWDYVCRPKAAGGLSFRNVQHWNMAALGSKEEETIAHLFFECGFSRSCLQELKKILQWNTPAINIHQLLQACHNTKRFSAARKSMVKTILASSVYFVWKARNEVLWNHQQWLITTTVKKAQQVSKMRIKGLLPKRAKDEDKEWILMV